MPKLLRYLPRIWYPPGSWLSVPLRKGGLWGPGGGCPPQSPADLTRRWRALGSLPRGAAASSAALYPPEGPGKAAAPAFESDYQPAPLTVEVEIQLGQVRSVEEALRAVANRAQ